MAEITLHREQTISTFPMDVEDGMLVVNFGPQHPSTHGVFRLVLKLEGETIVDAVPVLATSTAPWRSFPSPALTSRTCHSRTDWITWRRCATTWLTR